MRTIKQTTALVILSMLVSCADSTGGGGPSGGTGGTTPGGSDGTTPGGGGDDDPLPGPPSGTTGDYVPLYADGTQVIEQIQYAEPDGTLVTYAGFRPVNRHAREGGEQWNDPVDNGTGHYFDFPTFYFQNRTYGLVIRDEVPAGRQKITVYMKPNVGTFINNGISMFRRVDPDAIEYGWKDGAGVYNPDGTTRCSADQTTFDVMCAAPPVLDYWRWDEDAGRHTEEGHKLRVGDKIEIAPAHFMDNTDGAHALIDGGGIRYYSFEQLYVVGKGMVPWYGIAPKLDSEPLPDAALSGGQASVSYNYSEEPHRVFQQSVNNVGAANMQRFVEGRRLFHTSFADGKHSESPDVNPVFTAHANQLGARYNEVRCLGCHSLDGRSPAAVVGQKLNTFGVLTAQASSKDSSTPDPTYGVSVQELTSTAGAPDYSVTVQSYTTTTHTLPDGETVEMHKPVYAFSGPVPAQYSVRQAPQVIGSGLLEAIDETTILALADPDDSNGDGVRGVPNWSIDPETGLKHLGRFGWKASKGSARQQAANAFLVDMGVTTPAYKTAACHDDPTSAACKTSTAKPSVSSDELDRLANYLQLLGVPAQRSLRSGYVDDMIAPPEHAEIDEAAIARGQQLFAQARCTACHVAELKTGKNHPMMELREQVIHPYTDLLLHDMGEDLADTLTEGEAAPSMWRTPPLWGIGALKYVQAGTGYADASKTRYLHDGRARTLMEAISWHGGEAEKSRARFEALSAADRAAVLAFLGSL